MPDSTCMACIGVVDSVWRNRNRGGAEDNRWPPSSAVSVVDTTKGTDYKRQETERQTDGQRDSVRLTLIGGSDWLHLCW